MELSVPLLCPIEWKFALQKFVNSVGLPFRDLLPESTMISTLEASKVKYRNRLFNPIVTIWAFLSQVLDTDKSLQNAVSRVVAWLAEAGEPIPSTDTGGYTKARIRLPEGLLKRLLGKTAQRLEEQAEPQDLWCGRHVRICDGSSVLMSDTKANQAVYPQHSNQAKGCGFPIAKIVVVFSLATGAVMDVLIATLKTSEVVLARQLYHHLLPGDVLLADRALGSYVDLVLVQSQQADAVFRKHQSRKSDFRCGKKLGIGDHIVTWHKPKRCPNGMKALEFATLPDQVQVREVHLLIRQKGFRPKEIILVTTLVDSKIYTKAKVAQLYKLRWEVEVNLRHVKTTLGMEMLRGKTPAMVRCGNLCPFDGLQLTADINVGGSEKGRGNSNKNIFARDSSASWQFPLPVGCCRTHEAPTALPDFVDSGVPPTCAKSSWSP